ncbi:MAG TPA: site-specific integrase [Patescibacteria group bacterium]|nr:site-specific integrase [Patescibacteria group bacterium]
MARVTFFLKDKKALSETAIDAYFFFKNQRMKMFTGMKIAPKLWDSEKQQVKRGATNQFIVNERLAKIKHDLEGIYHNLLNNHIPPTPALIKEKYQELTNYVPVKKEPTFFERFEEFLILSSSTKKVGTIKSYRTTLNHLKAFEGKTGVKITFDSIDSMFYDKFLHFLFNEHNKTANGKVVDGKKDEKGKVDIGLNSNTAGKSIKVLKTFLRYATENGFNEKMNFTKFKVLTEEATSVHITSEEIKKLIALDLSQNNRLDAVRDIFLLSCYIGLRYSDISRLKSENIQNGYISIQVIKTKEPLRIPLVPQARDILKKYEGKSLHIISNQRMNDYLKELAKLAKIDEPIQIITHKGAQRLEKLIPKYELISTHTGRRTFVTLSLEKGMRPETVMRITGHKDLKSFKKYIKITERVTEQELMRAWSE